MEILVGVDAGATKTEAVALTTGMAYIGRGRSGPGNPASAGVSTSCRSITEAVRISISGRASPEIMFIGIGLAGWAGGSWDRELSECISSTLGVAKDSIEIMEDLEAAHYSAFLGGEGIVAVLGTGSSFLGISRGVKVRVGGWGHLLGDEGGSWRIGVKGLRAVFMSIDGRLGPTSLVKKALERFGARDHIDLLRIIYSSPDVKSLIASFAVDVFQAAREGDAEAVKILEEEAEEIAIAYKAIAERIGVLPLAIVGSTYHANADIWAPMIKNAIARRVGFKIEIRGPALDQACASLLLGLSKRGVGVDIGAIPKECSSRHGSWDSS